MNDKLRETINTMLVSYFNEIMELEERAIITEEFSDISNNDMHIIEAIGLEGNRMTLIANKLNITVGSLTTSMNGLVKKGYVERKRTEEDRRVVNIYLLEKGIKAYRHHEDFHRRMTDALISTVTEEELITWVKSFEALNKFFREEAEKQVLK